MPTLRGLKDAAVGYGVLFSELLAFDVESLGAQRIVCLDLVHYHE